MKSKNEKDLEKIQSIKGKNRLILDFYSKVKDIDKDIDKSQLIGELINNFNDISPEYYHEECNIFKHLDLESMQIMRKFVSRQFSAIIVKIPVIVQVLVNNSKITNITSDEATIELKLENETGKFTTEKVSYLSNNCINATEIEFIDENSSLSGVQVII